MKIGCTFQDVQGTPMLMYMYSVHYVCIYCTCMYTVHTCVHVHCTYTVHYVHVHDVHCMHDFMFHKYLNNLFTSIVLSDFRIFCDQVCAYHQFKKNCGLNITQSSLLLISEFATSRGKTACDGVSGTLKQLVSKASLQRPYDNQIITPQQLYEFACKEIKRNAFLLHNNWVAQQRRKSLKISLWKCTHYPRNYKPVSKDCVEVCEFSSSHTCTIDKNV